jgi:hypothetical protein
LLRRRWLIIVTILLTPESVNDDMGFRDSDKGGGAA